MLHPSLTADDPILLTIADDTEEAPWMAMGDPQMLATSNLYLALRTYAHRHARFWYVASMVPILYPRPGTRRKGRLAPDLFVAFVEDRHRQSFDIEAEGGFPPFVLEVLSPESTARDLGEKVRAYGRLGAQEYALFAPSRDLGQPALQGYRRETGSGAFVPWELSDPERLFSDVLGVWLEADGPLLRARTTERAVLPTYEELGAAYSQLETAHEQLETALRQLQGAYEQEAEARRELEHEVRRLREALERRQQQ